MRIEFNHWFARWLFYAWLLVYTIGHYDAAKAGFFQILADFGSNP